MSVAVFWLLIPCENLNSSGSTPQGQLLRVTLFLKVLELNPALHRCLLYKGGLFSVARVAAVLLALDLGLRPFGKESLQKSDCKEV